MRTAWIERLAWLGLGVVLGFFGTLTLRSPGAVPVTTVTDLEREIGRLRERIVALESESPPNVAIVAGETREE